MSDHADFRASLVKFLQDHIPTMVQLGLTRPDAVYFDFEGMSEVKDIPDTDVVGFMNLHWVNDGNFYEVGVSLGVSTIEDKGLIRKNDMIGYLAEQIKPKMQIPLVDAKTGVEDGWLVIHDGVSLMPAMRMDTRTLQFFMLGMKASRTT
jgi:hypothetical protein